MAHRGFGRARHAAFGAIVVIVFAVPSASGADTHQTSLPLVVESHRAPLAALPTSPVPVEPQPASIGAHPSSTPESMTSGHDALYQLKTQLPMSHYALAFDHAVEEPLRDDFRRATAQLTEITGITFSEASPSNGHTPATGEIRVIVANRCEIADESGCTTTWDGQGRIRSVEISIAPITVDAWWRYDTVLHELGHAVGLAHVDTAGRPAQVLDLDGNTVFDRYQSGDIAGLKALAALAAVAPAGAGNE